MQASQLNLLVVEDDDFQRHMVVEMLQSLGVTSINEVCNGKQALEVVRKMDATAQNIAVCDLNMPEMDGMEFLRHLGKESRNISVIITSALDRKVLSSVSRMVKMYDIELLGTVEKPILRERLQEILAQYKQSDAKWAQVGAARQFELEEILQGVRANQIEPYFQPKVDLKTGRLIGAEALARWLHPEYGEISPAAFIPTLEVNGLIDDLTLLILEKSAIACRLLIERGHILSISVNISLVSLHDENLADHLTQVVRNAGVDPQYIVLEITESAAISDIGRVLENLARLCMRGFTLSIDDYGTGYSSMQQLTRIAFSELKIDQSFVKDFTESEILSVVVESSIDIAHKLQMKSTAEGVETDQDRKMLSQMGCDVGQGYLFAKPMNLAAFLEFAKNYTPRC
ncbi:EAL domain-containing protein [Chitinibacter sp. S2-10]|uniref:EAL domain-containing response regulator n=1 Tax=Chitinibacter sp. S2-10 TaxID=3373597 RepID=UPI0039772C36